MMSRWVVGSLYGKSCQNCLVPNVLILSFTSQSKHFHSFSLKSIKSQVLTAETMDAGQRIKTSTSPTPGAGVHWGGRGGFVVQISYTILTRRQKDRRANGRIPKSTRETIFEPFSNHFRLAVEG